MKDTKNFLNSTNNLRSRGIFGLRVSLGLWTRVNRNFERIMNTWTPALLLCGVQVKSFHHFSRVMLAPSMSLLNNSNFQDSKLSNKTNGIALCRSQFISSNFYSDIIKIPSKVTIRKVKNSLFFEGPLGSVEMDISKIDLKGQGFFRICTAKDILSPRFLTSDINDKSSYLEVFVKKTSKTSKAFFGTLLSLYRNNLYGVCQGFLIYLELIGVGFRAIIHENQVDDDIDDNMQDNMDLGSSCMLSSIESSISKSGKLIQKVEFKVGQSHEIIYKIPENLRIFSLKPTLICLYGLDKIQVTQVASEIRNLKVPEPYKGKGIRYKDEIVRIRVGKKK